MNVTFDGACNHLAACSTAVRLEARAEHGHRAHAARDAAAIEVERGTIVDKALKHVVWPKLMSPTFAIDYPLELSPLAKAHRDDPRLVERFQILGVAVGSPAADHAVERLLRGALHHRGEQAFLDALKGADVSIAHVKKSIEETLLINKFLAGVVEKGAAVTDEAWLDRWGVEEAIQEAKQCLGFETTQGWCSQTVNRQAPLAMVLVTLARALKQRFDRHAAIARRTLPLWANTWT